MATAELAVALPVLVVLVLFGAGLVNVLREDLRCEDAARLGARAAARGEPAATAQAIAQAAAPMGAVVTVSQNGARVTVSVLVRVAVPGPWAGEGPRIAVTGEAVADLESVPG